MYVQHLLSNAINTTAPVCQRKFGIFCLFGPSYYFGFCK